MHKRTVLFTGIISALMVIICLHSFAQEETPVHIRFDKNSKRIDLITGRELPNYRDARRGSFQFFLGRLDTPDDFINYFHDGVRSATITSLASMEKVQPKFAIWRLRYKSGTKNTPRIHHLAVSFIPMSQKTGETERRVYLLLNDLELIDWGTENN